MNKDLTRLADVMLGEAVVTLLRNEDDICADSVVQQLRSMANTEAEPDRREALALALGQVLSEYTQSRGSRDATVLALNVPSDSDCSVKK